jgi:hypothetical protein
LGDAVKNWRVSDKESVSEISKIRILLGMNAAVLLLFLQRIAW